MLIRQLSDDVFEEYDLVVPTPPLDSLLIGTGRLLIAVTCVVYRQHGQSGVNSLADFHLRHAHVGCWDIHSLSSSLFPGRGSLSFRAPGWSITGAGNGLRTYHSSYLVECCV